MDIHPIRTARDHAEALRKIERLWGARRGTGEADELEVLVTLVDAYEARRHPIDPPDPIDAILFIAKLRDKLGISADVLIGSHRRAA